MTRFLTFTLLLAWSVLPAAAADPSASVRLYLELAEASRAAYDDGPDVVVTPAGCAARITTRADGALVIAFRGSMLGDRSGRGRFSTFGGATMRRNYRDWAATNLKQTAGFLPRQYL
ncbi:MAG: hypothetical protein LIP77_07760, partial [Planctomycetes bacterium]|nr:hypothetical protein [Planctomycetota bacterium]